MKRTAAVIMIFGLLSVGAFADTNDEAQNVYTWSKGAASVGEAVLGSAGYAAGAFVGAVLAPTSTAGPETDEMTHLGTASDDNSDGGQ